MGGAGRGFPRRAPAGALYPLEVYLAAGNVRDLAAGVYRYVPGRHRLELVAAAERRTTAKYGERGVRYVHLEAGHAAQNVLLQAVAVGAGTTVVGASSDDAVGALAGLKKDERALYLIPVGVPR